MMKNEPQSKLTIRTDQMGQILVFYLAGNMDMYDAYKLRDYTEEAIGKGNLWLLINLRDVAYMDSVGTGILIECNRKLSRKNGAFVLAECGKWVSKTAYMMNLQRVIKIFETMEQASQYLNQLIKREAS